MVGHSECKTNAHNDPTAELPAELTQSLELNYAKPEAHERPLGGGLKVLAWYLVIKIILILLGSVPEKMIHYDISSSSVLTIISVIGSFILLMLYVFAFARLIEKSARQLVTKAMYATILYGIIARIGLMLTGMQWPSSLEAAILAYLTIADLVIPICWVIYMKTSERVRQVLTE